MDSPESLFRDVIERKLCIKGFEKRGILENRNNLSKRPDSERDELIELGHSGAMERSCYPCAKDPSL